MITRNRMIGLAIASLAVGVLFVAAAAPASADDRPLTVTPAVYRTELSPGGSSIQMVRHGYYGRGGWGGGYRGYGGYGYRGYGYRPYYRPYIYGGYPAYGYGYPGYGYGYPAYGYGYPAYGYGYPGYGYYGYGPGVGVGVGVW